MNNEYELIIFGANWADEMDINSFSIRPKGYLKELLELQSNLFEDDKDYEVYVGSNQNITFSKIEEPGAGKTTLEESLYCKPLTENEKNTLEKFFGVDKTFGYDFLFSVEDKIADSVESIDPKSHPVFYKLLQF